MKYYLCVACKNKYSGRQCRKMLFSGRWYSFDIYLVKTIGVKARTGSVRSFFPVFEAVCLVCVCISISLCTHFYCELHG